VWSEKDRGRQMFRIALLISHSMFGKRDTPGLETTAILSTASLANGVVGAARDLPIDDADAWDGPAAAKRMLDEAGFDGYRKRLGDL
jgi:hypothetical protein